MNYANQKKIEVPKEEAIEFFSGTNDKDFLHSLKWEKIYPVARELSGNEFKIWLYCFKWNSAGEFFYSPATLEKDFGISESTAQRSLQKLEKLGYIEKKPGSVNSYIFHPDGARMYSK